jgi:hypothetical protein
MLYAQSDESSPPVKLSFTNTPQPAALGTGHNYRLNWKSRPGAREAARIVLDDACDRPGVPVPAHGTACLTAHLHATAATAAQQEAGW